MATYDLPSRRARYFTISSQIAHMDNAELRSVFSSTETQPGWGRNHILDIARSKVFVKRLPLTQLEYDNLFSTKNLYELPTYYNYGVGSAGLGVFRELVANIKTTNWVLEGKIANFPLLYHYRIIPFSDTRPEVEDERRRGYVEHWNSNENIGRYMLDRTNAPYELLLFLEHFPYTLGPWLLENPKHIERVLDELRKTITFLRKNGIIHFDAHFDNILSDGEQPYLTDFGLVLDKRFALTDDEASFLKQNTHYDYGELLGSLGFLLARVYEELPDADKRRLTERFGLGVEPSFAELLPLLLRNIEELVADGNMKVDASYIAVIVKYRSVIELFLDFYISMRSNKKKDTKFPHARLIRLLKETNYLPGSI